MTLAFALVAALTAHPIETALTLAGIGLVGLALNATTGPVVNFGAFSQAAFSQLLGLCGSQVNTIAQAGAATIPSGYLTGAMSVFLLNSAAAPTTQTTQTATQLVADLLAAFGVAALPPNFSYDLQISNSGAGTYTLAGGTGVTITGLATIANNANRQFNVKVTSNTTITITDIGGGTYT